MPDHLEQTQAFLAFPTVHLCVDMQRMFAEETDWRTPWMSRVLPRVERLVAHRLADTVFTRFIPPRTAQEAKGAWCEYFTRWHQFTRAEMDEGLTELVPELARFAPPAMVVDKVVYSPFQTGDLDALLEERGAQTLIVTGAETDVCVLAAVMGAVDHGYRVVLPRDALCSSTDETHDALIALYDRRYSQQIALTDVETVLSLW
ncbi:cysteine hydrolase family protein [Aureimonas populi]|uniref:Cysteine hydrolase family protein n=1 Tax=Aureimonas populi TaxID=1701758 RepID=A0ABW5CQ19_9HYPH|nr:isochorismatase family cysteine hydrolase [Aureimonas populi]